MPQAWGLSCEPYLWLNDGSLTQFFHLWDEILDATGSGAMTSWACVVRGGRTVMCFSRWHYALFSWGTGRWIGPGNDIIEWKIHGYSYYCPNTACYQAAGWISMKVWKRKEDRTDCANSFHIVYSQNHSAMCTHSSTAVAFTSQPWDKTLPFHHPQFCACPGPTFLPVRSKKNS